MTTHLFTLVIATLLLQSLAAQDCPQPFAQGPACDSAALQCLTLPRIGTTFRVRLAAAPCPWPIGSGITTRGGRDYGDALIAFGPCTAQSMSRPPLVWVKDDCANQRCGWWIETMTLVFCSDHPLYMVSELPIPNIPGLIGQPFCAAGIYLCYPEGPGAPSEQPCMRWENTHQMVILP